jgi:hypothetical protein
MDEYVKLKYEVQLGCRNDGSADWGFTEMAGFKR